MQLRRRKKYAGRDAHVFQAYCSMNPYSLQLIFNEYGLIGVSFCILRKENLTIMLTLPALFAHSPMEIIPLLADLWELRQAALPGPVYALLALILLAVFVSWLTIYFYKWHLIKQYYLEQQKELISQSLYFCQRGLTNASCWNCILYLLTTIQYREELQRHTRRCLSPLPLCAILFLLLACI